MELSFLRLPPSADLSDHVLNFWFMAGESAAMPEGHRILPDGCMEFVFQLGDPFRERDVFGKWRLQNHRLLVGQMERPVDIKPSGAIDTVGIHFRPAGAAPFIGGDLSRFLNRIVPLDHALGEDLKPLARRVAATRKAEKRMALLEAFLRRRQGPADAEIARAANALAAGSGPVDLGVLARDLTISERHFRRRFEASVGLPPKRFSRLVRFQRVFEERRESDARAWSQVALECGYYDQAHFNRDFKAFTLMKPRELVKDADPLTEFFLSVSSKTPRRARA